MTTNKVIDLEKLEIQLKKRLKYPYNWGRKQSNDWDKNTNFIYETRSFSDLEKRIESLDTDLQNYALNRWLNFWSAKGVEQIFALDKRVKPNVNEYDKLIDFTIDGIPFDHKTSVFPKGLNKSFHEAIANKNKVIRWFYENQSQQGRKHYKNRIFVVLGSKDNEHWKLKTEIGLLKTYIEQYLNDFSVEKLEKITFEQEEILADIIWITN